MNGESNNQSLPALYGRVVEAVWSYRRPFLAVFLLATGFHGAVVVRLPWTFSWLPGAVLLLGWGLQHLLLKTAWAPQWGSRDPVSRIVDTMPGGWAAAFKSAREAVLGLALLCTLPAPTGIVFCAIAGVFACCFFSRPAHFFLTRPQRSATGAVEGPNELPMKLLMVTVWFLLVEAGALLVTGLSLQWHWRTCSAVTLAVAGGYVLVAVAITGAASGKVLPGASARRGRPAAPMYELGLLAVPIFISFWRDDWTTFAVLTGVAVLAVSLFSMYLANDRLRQAQHACWSALQRDTPDNLLLQAVQAEGEEEDVFLGSDGYYRILRPGYVPLRGTRRTEAGFVSWVRRDAFHHTGTSAQTSAEWIALRGLSGVGSSILQSKDGIGQEVHRLMGRLLPVSQHEELLTLAEKFDQQRPLEVVLNEKDLRLLKCPWDGAEVLMIPFTWSATVYFPPGSGLYDAKGKPCYAKEVVFSIDLQRPIRAAVESLRTGGASAREIAMLRRLFSLFQRILPTCFETLLLSAIVELRQDEIKVIHEPAKQKPLLDPDDAAISDVISKLGSSAKTSVAIEELLKRESEKLAAAAAVEHEIKQAEQREDYRRRVESRLRSSLPDEIHELVDCKLAKIEIDSYLLAKDTRELDSKIDSEQRNQPIVLQALRKGIYDALEQQLLGGGGPRNRTQGEVQLAKDVNAELAKIGSAIRGATEQLLARFASVTVDQTRIEKLPQLQQALEEQTGRLLDLLKTRRAAVEAAFARFNDAFRNKPRT